MPILVKPLGGGFFNAIKEEKTTRTED